jgi:inhibitor of KinA
LKIFPIGDSSVTIELGNLINEELNLKVQAIQQWLSSNRFEGLKDMISSYSSLSVFYDPVLIRRNYPEAKTAYEFVKIKLEEAWNNSEIKEQVDSTIISIPVCYDDYFGTDLHFLSKEKGLPKEDIVGLHTYNIYRVYMIGFLPGFSYLGDVDEQLIIPRKSRPVPVAAGSVGIAGRQTGIYPLNSPGGWQIIGRTPVKLFDPFAAIPVKLKMGDRVKFYAITKEEYENG